jgi:hypothetical protein
MLISLASHSILLFLWIDLRWFSGTWTVRSETMDVQAPCGVGLFGGNATYQAAKSDVGNILKYESRFINDGSGHVTADREYNVRSIAR